MKLIAETSNAEQAQRYQCAFDTLVRLLGIEALPFKVWLVFVNRPPEVDFDSGGLSLKLNGGSTFNDIVDNHVRMEINEYKPTCPCPNCRNVGRNWIEVFCHEMAHVKQLVTGELYKGKYETRGLWWQGKLYDPLPEYEDMPWEHDAVRLERELYPQVKQALWENRHADRK